MAWKVLEIRDASGGRHSLLVWWCLSQCRSTIRNIKLKKGVRNWPQRKQGEGRKNMSEVGAMFGR